MNRVSSEGFIAGYCAAWFIAWQLLAPVEHVTMFWRVAGSLGLVVVGVHSYIMGRRLETALRRLGR